MGLASAYFVILLMVVGMIIFMGVLSKIPTHREVRRESREDEAVGQVRRVLDQIYEETDDGTFGAASSEGRPLVTHGGEDCTGGSIHIDRHEGSEAPSSGEGRPARSGTPKRPVRGTEAGRTEGTAGAEGGRKNRRPGNAADAQRVQNAAAPAQDDAVNGAERLQKAMEGRPAAVQGIIWSEVLSAPMSERGH